MAKAVAIAGVILRDKNGRYLLVQEKKASVYGLWNWPAGHVDPGETLQEAAAREALEETGLTVRIISPEPLYIGPGDKATAHVVHSFYGEVVSGQLDFQTSELLDAKWFS